MIRFIYLFQLLRRGPDRVDKIRRIITEMLTNRSLNQINETLRQYKEVSNKDSHSYKLAIIYAF